MSDWFSPSKASEIKACPWLSGEATRFLESLLEPGFDVIEHGSGGSTLWFAERVHSVTSYEQDDDWYRVVKDAAPQDRVRMRTGLPEWMNREYDLLLIDGEPVEDRAKWLYAAPGIVKPGGYVVLDNANRPEYALERAVFRKSAECLARFDGNQPGFLYLITEFYRL